MSILAHLAISGRSTDEIRHISPPPGKQGSYTRWSLVFFTRPGNSIRLQALTEESALIADAVEKAPAHLRAIFESGQTSYEWFTRRVKNMRTNNQKVRFQRDSRDVIGLTGLPGSGCMACQPWDGASSACCLQCRVVATAT